MALKILVTGATGFIGRHLCEKLAGEGHSVFGLFRSSDKIPVSAHSNIEFVKGDITRPAGYRHVIEQCDEVYHLAAYAKVFAQEVTTYKRLNYDATLNLLDNALEAGVKKVLICSTAGVFGPSRELEEVDEDTVRWHEYFSDYERYKDLADHEIIRTCFHKIDVRIVCPTRVFGPGLLSESNAVTKLIGNYVKGKFRFLPGNGNTIGNYVFVEDVVQGMILAMQKGVSGERYILGGENVSYRELFNCVAEVSGVSHKLYKVPVTVILGFSYIMLFLARMFGIKPLLTPGWARKYLYNWKVSSAKAESELGYTHRSVKEGVEDTVRWMREGRKAV